MTETVTFTETPHTTFADLLDKYEAPLPQQGQILEGEILRMDEDALYIDVGAKRDAIVPYHELIELGDTLLDDLSRGDEVPVYVVTTPRGDDELIVSLQKGLQRQDWQEAAQLMADDKIVDCEVIGHNKGGFLVQYGRIRGFVPNSHVPELRHIHDARQKASFKSKQVGQKIALKVVEVNYPKQKLVFSAKEAEAEKRRQRLQELQVGDVVNGRVASLVDFGAFIDLDGVDGLLHISNIAWNEPSHPNEILSVGDEVEVRIDGVDVERERINLNLKALQPTPFGQFAQEHDSGDMIEGIVTNLVDFGAFVEVAPHVEGLIHISEISDTHIAHPDAVLQEGDKVLAHILNIETANERLGLSMRRVSVTEQLDWMAQ
jgi:small subunit ribosomal protein S1